MERILAVTVKYLRPDHTATFSCPSKCWPEQGDESLWIYRPGAGGVYRSCPMTCPLAEYLVLKMSSYYHFEKNPPRVERAKIALPTKPGFGIELDPAKVERSSQLKLR
jgi:hypothetical protein